MQNNPTIESVLISELQAKLDAALKEQWFHEDRRNDAAASYWQGQAHAYTNAIETIRFAR